MTGLFLSLTFSTVYADAYFAQHTLIPEGQVQSVQGACLRGDAAKDLVVSARLGNYPAYAGSLSIWRDFKQIWKLDFKGGEQPWGYDLAGDCGKQQRQRLLLFFQRTLDLYEEDATHNWHRTKQLAINAGGFTGEAGNLLPIDLVRDFNGDGLDDFIYAGVDGSLWLIEDLFGAAPRNYSLRYPLKTFLRTMPPNQPLGIQFTARQSRWFPNVVSADYDGDGRLDLLVVWLDEFSVYLQDTQRSFRTAAATAPTRLLGLLTEEDRMLGNTSATVIFADVGKDPFVDFIANRVAGTIADLDTGSKLYQRSATGEKIVTLASPSGKASGALLLDVNGDGRPDIVTASAQTGLFASVRALLNNTVEVRFHFHLADAAGNLPTEPSFRRELGFKFDVKRFTPYGFMPSLDGDFNGDGLLDALYGRDQNSMQIILQRRDGELFPQDISYKGKVEVSELFAIDDLNRDGLSEVVFWYRDWQRRSRVLVLINSGEIKNERRITPQPALQ